MLATERPTRVGAAAECFSKRWDAMLQVLRYCGIVSVCHRRWQRDGEDYARTSQKSAERTQMVLL
jgi:hypothetical protein